MSKIEESIIVFYTGKTRHASTLLNAQSENMTRADKRKLMTKMVSLVYDMKNSIENDDIDILGELLDHNWQLKRQITDSITNSFIDDIYSKAIQAGAKGGKLLGAGSGGFMMFYAPKDKHFDISRALKSLKKVPFYFEKAGSDIIYSDE